MAQTIGGWMGDYDKTLHVVNGLRNAVLMLAKDITQIAEKGNLPEGPPGAKTYDPAAST
jgi:hypothetical protein